MRPSRDINNPMPTARGWIFQGNPKTYDIDGYLASRWATGEPITWLTSSYYRTIRPGDTAYMWRARDKKGLRPSGIIAKARVASTPRVMPPDAPELFFATPASENYRVKLKLLSVRLTDADGMLSEQVLKSDGRTDALQIFEFRNATNFSLTKRQAEALAELWESVPKRVDIDRAYWEGKGDLKQHFVRERSQELIADAKQAFLQKHGRLYCEACGFDFGKVYGDRGKDFIEVHHDTPLSSSNLRRKVRPSELSMLCSNCHCMIHVLRPWLEVAELRKLIRKK